MLGFDTDMYPLFLGSHALRGDVFRAIKPNDVLLRIGIKMGNLIRFHFNFLPDNGSAFGFHQTSGKLN